MANVGANLQIPVPLARFNIAPDRSRQTAARPIHGRVISLQRNIKPCRARLRQKMQGIDGRILGFGVFKRPIGECAAVPLHGQGARNRSGHHRGGITLCCSTRRQPPEQIVRPQQGKRAGNGLLQTAVGIMHHVIHGAGQLHRRRARERAAHAHRLRQPIRRRRDDRDFARQHFLKEGLHLRARRRPHRQFDGFSIRLASRRDLNGTQRLARPRPRHQRHGKVRRSTRRNDGGLLGGFHAERASAHHPHGRAQFRAAFVHQRHTRIAVIADGQKTRQRRLNNQIALHLHRLRGHARLLRVIGHGHQPQFTGKFRHIELNLRLTIGIQRNSRLPQRDRLEAVGLDGIQSPPQQTFTVAARSRSGFRGAQHHRHQRGIQIVRCHPKRALSHECLGRVRRLKRRQHANGLIHRHHRHRALGRLPVRSAHGHGRAQGGLRTRHRRRAQFHLQIAARTRHRHRHSANRPMHTPHLFLDHRTYQRECAIHIGRIRRLNGHVKLGGIFLQLHRARFNHAVRLHGQQRPPRERRAHLQSRDITGLIARLIQRQLHAAGLFPAPRLPRLLRRSRIKGNPRGRARLRVFRHQHINARRIHRKCPLRLLARQRHCVALHLDHLPLRHPFVAPLLILAQHRVPRRPLNGDQQRLRLFHSRAIRLHGGNSHSLRLAHAHPFPLPCRLHADVERIGIHLFPPISRHGTPTGLHHGHLLHHFQRRRRTPRAPAIRMKFSRAIFIQRLRPQLAIHRLKRLLLVAELPARPLRRSKRRRAKRDGPLRLQPGRRAPKQIGALHGERAHIANETALCRRLHIHTNLRRHKILQRHRRLAQHGERARHRQLQRIASGRQKFRQLDLRADRAEGIRLNRQIAIHAAIRAAHPQNGRERLRRAHLAVAQQRLHENRLAGPIHAALAEYRRLHLIRLQIVFSAQPLPLRYGCLRQINIRQIIVRLRHHQKGFGILIRRPRQTRQPLLVSRARGQHLIVLRIQRHRRAPDRLRRAQRIHPNQPLLRLHPRRDAQVRHHQQPAIFPDVRPAHFQPINALRRAVRQLSQIHFALRRLPIAPRRQHVCLFAPGAPQIVCRPLPPPAIPPAQRQMHQIIGKYRLHPRRELRHVNRPHRHPQRTARRQIRTRRVNLHRGARQWNLHRSLNRRRQARTIHRRQPFLDAHLIDFTRPEIAPNHHAAIIPHA